MSKVRAGSSWDDIGGCDLLLIRGEVRSAIKSCVSKPGQGY